MEKISRNQLQEKLMITIYQYLFYFDTEQKISLKDLVNNNFNCDLKELDKFAKEVLVKVLTSTQELVDQIQSKLVKWKFERLNMVERAILLLGSCELLYTDTPRPVVLNVCIKLAQKYCDDNQYQYINAVLEKIHE